MTFIGLAMLLSMAQADVPPTFTWGVALSHWDCQKEDFGWMCVTTYGYEPVEFKFEKFGDDPQSPPVYQATQSVEHKFEVNEKPLSYRVGMTAATGSELGSAFWAIIDLVLGKDNYDGAGGLTLNFKKYEDLLNIPDTETDGVITWVDGIGFAPFFAVKKDYAAAAREGIQKRTKKIHRVTRPFDLSRLTGFGG